jgi:hypothetical protein
MTRIRLFTTTTTEETNHELQPELGLNAKL